MACSELSEISDKTMAESGSQAGFDPNLRYLCPLHGAGRHGKGNPEGQICQG